MFKNLFIASVLLLNLSCGRNNSDFQPQVVEIDEASYDFLTAAEKKGLISLEEIQAIISESQGQSEEQINKKFLKIIYNKKKIVSNDDDAKDLFENSENTMTAEDLETLFSSYYQLAINGEESQEKNGIYYKKLRKLRSSKNKKLLGLIHAINQKLENLDVDKITDEYEKLSILISIFNYSLINHLNRNDAKKKIKNLRDLTVTKDLREIAAQFSFNLGQELVGLNDIQSKVLELKVSQNQLKAYIPFMFFSGAKGEQHLLERTYSYDPVTLGAQLKLQIDKTLKYPSFVTLDKESETIQLVQDFFLPIKNAVNNDNPGSFDQVIKFFLRDKFEVDISNYKVILDLPYDYSLDQVD